MDSVDPPSKLVSLALMRICFRDWCQEQLVRVTMSPEDYTLYSKITWNFFDRQVTPYNEFRHQMRVLLQNPDYASLRVYWHFVDRWMTGAGVQIMAIHPQFPHPPMDLCRQLNLIPVFAFVFFGNPALWNQAPRRSRQMAALLAAGMLTRQAAPEVAPEFAQQEAAQQEIAQEAARCMLQSELS